MTTWGKPPAPPKLLALSVLHCLGALVLPPILPPHSGLVPSFPSIPTGSVLLKRMEEGPHREPHRHQIQEPGESGKQMSLPQCPSLLPTLWGKAKHCVDLCIKKKNKNLHLLPLGIPCLGLCLANFLSALNLLPHSHMISIKILK